MYLTVTVYQDKNLINEKTGKNPIRLGPMMLHAKADKGCYEKFFNTIKEKLGALENVVLETTGAWSTDNLLVGSDEELAMGSVSTKLAKNGGKLCKKIMPA